MENFKKGFAQIPNQLIYDDRLSNEAKVLFCYIKSLSSNYRNLRNSNLRSKLGCSINTLQNAKNELVKHGYLVIHRLSSANRYTLKIPTDYPKIKQSDYPKIKQPDYPKIGYHYKSNNNNNNNNNNNTNIKKFKGFKK
jgi:hypothetical protein